MFIKQKVEKSWQVKGTDITDVIIVFVYLKNTGLKIYEKFRIIRQKSKQIGKQKLNHQFV